MTKLSLPLWLLLALVLSGCNKSPTYDFVSAKNFYFCEDEECKEETPLTDILKELREGICPKSKELL